MIEIIRFVKIFSVVKEQGTVPGQAFPHVPRGFGCVSSGNRQALCNQTRQFWHTGEILNMALQNQDIGMYRHLDTYIC
jgi:hypothetical protein